MRAGILPKSIGTLKRMVVRRAPGRLPHRGLLSIGPHVFPCALGRSGISVLKREGDLATPSGSLAVIAGYGHSRQMPAVKGMRSRLRNIRRDLGWCDDPANPNYNRPVRLPCGSHHETMLREDGLYDVCLVTDWNLKPRRRNAGSAIFMHIAKPGLQPTQGCIALDRATIFRLLPRMAANIRILVYP
jgi:L,D-peptidoglycan transpeptidase YkuD (ErfK/YbiS/YcfS/YnhG family)